MIRTCQKCGHINPEATGGELEACPECGAIYSRVAEAMATKAAPGAVEEFQDPRTTARPAGGAAAARSDGGINGFAERMREGSLYPTFRGLVRMIYFVWMALAVLAAVVGLAGLFTASGGARVGIFIGGAFFTLFFAVIAKVTREAALMLADLSDAAVQIAARMKT